MNNWECTNGHAYTEENTYVHTEGWRRCRTCDRDRQTARRAAARTKNKAAARTPIPVTIVTRPTSADTEQWRDWASCATIGGDLWFPDKGEAQLAQRAKNICSTCPVRQKCLTVALEDGETEGIWGGLSPLERKQLRRESA